jgi:hypothetical protein
MDAKEAPMLRTTLEERGHPQPPTPLQTYNTTVMGYSSDTIKQRRIRDMDMRFNWVKVRVNEGQFHVYWGLDIKIWPITSQNIIRQHITKGCERCIYTRVYNRCIEQEFEIPLCEGVLIPNAQLART